MTELEDLFEGSLTLDTNELKQMSNVRGDGNESSSSGLNYKKIQNFDNGEGEQNQIIDVKGIDVTKKHMVSFGFDKFDQADQAMIDGFGSFSSSLDFSSKNKKDE